MQKCVKIIFSVAFGKDLLVGILQKNARVLELEGSVLLLGQDQVKVIACGAKENVESFVDLIHKEAEKYKLEAIEVEPFLKDKDYRGIFRIIA